MNSVQNCEERKLSNTTINIENLEEVNSSIFTKQGNVKCDKYTNNENKVIVLLLNLTTITVLHHHHYHHYLQQ